MAVSSRHKGWSWDRDNGRLDFYYNGTRIGHINASGMDLATGLSYTVNGVAVTASTLDAAYDGSGSGAGRAITVDSGAVDINSNHASNNAVEISEANAAGTGSLIDLTHARTASKDIDGTSSSWYVTAAGAITAVSITLTGDIDLATSNTGTYDLILKANQADALSIRDSAGDFIVFDSTTGANAITVTPATTFNAAVTVGAGGITVTGASSIAGAVTISTGGIAVTGVSSIVGDTTITGALTVSGALNWGGATVISNSLTVDELYLDTDGTAPSAGHANGEIVYSSSGNILYISVPTGDTIDLQVNATTEMRIGAALTVINESSNDRDFRVESGGLSYALYVDGGKDAVEIGGNTDVTDADTSLRISTVAKTITNNENFAILWVEPVGATTLQGTNAIVATAYFKEPNLTDPGAGGSATIAATVYIADAPSEGDANYGLYVAAGAVAIASGALTVEGAVTINDASADVDFRVESNNLQYALYVDGGKDCVVVGDNTDISDVDYRLMVGNVAKTLVDNQSASILYVAPTASTTESGTGATTHLLISTAYFSEPNITHAGTSAITTAATVYIADAPTEGNTNNAALFVAAGATMLGGTTYIGDTANANVTLGLTINQAGNDDIILGLKSSDVATGLTSASGGTETDDFGAFRKVAPATGGLKIVSLGENAAVNANFIVESYGGQADTTKSTAARGLIELLAAQHDGANALSNIAADGNVFVVQGRVGGAFVTLSILDEDGDLWLGGGLTTTAGITVTGGQVIKSSSATEIGITVDNSALTVGSAGSIKVPYLSQTGAAFSDAIGGDQDGCIGINYDSDTGPTNTLEARSQASWVSVALSGVEMQGKTAGGSSKHGEKWHSNQIIEDGFVDETICVICGKKIKVDEPVVLYPNYERKTPGGHNNLHAVFAHLKCAK